MTLQEFKAWFGGFTEDMDTAPNKKQWERIKARVDVIDGAAVSPPRFVERYWPPRGYWERWSAVHFNSAQAMLALGKADYQSMS